MHQKKKIVQRKCSFLQRMRGCSTCCHSLPSKIKFQLQNWSALLLLPFVTGIFQQKNLPVIKKEREKYLLSVNVFICLSVDISIHTWGFSKPPLLFFFLYNNKAVRFSSKKKKGPWEKTVIIIKKKKCRDERSARQLSAKWFPNKERDQKGIKHKGSSFFFRDKLI